jgi:hypothetical protein
VRAISNDSASPRLIHVTAKATGAGEGANVGVFNGFSSPTMTDVTATASGGETNFGVAGNNLGSSPTTIKQSKLSGSGPLPSSALLQEAGSAKVGLSELVGGVQASANASVQCFNNYDENLAAVTCQQ